MKAPLLCEPWRAAEIGSCYVFGDLLGAGDDIVFLGNIHRVEAVERHPTLRNARIARASGDWSMTIFDDAGVQVTSATRSAVVARYLVAVAKAAA